LRRGLYLHLLGGKGLRYRVLAALEGDQEVPRGHPTVGDRVGVGAGRQGAEVVAFELLFFVK